MTSCATHRWSSPISQLLAKPTRKKVHKDIDKQRKVICYVSDLDNTDPEARGNTTLGIAVGPRLCVANHLLSKKQTSSEPFQLCQDPPTEFASFVKLGRVSIVNLIFRVHGHTNLEDETAAKTFDDVGLGVTRQFFPRVRGTVRSKPR